MRSHINKELELEIQGRKYKVTIEALSGDKARVRVDGKTIEVGIKTPANADRPAKAARVASTSRPPAPEKAASRPAETGSDSGSSTLNALMPGVVVKIVVEKGQKVATGDVVLVLEAMKMENEIKSSRSGTIDKIHVSVGQQVQPGEPLVSFT